MEIHIIPLLDMNLVISFLINEKRNAISVPFNFILFYNQHWNAGALYYIVAHTSQNKLTYSAKSAAADNNYIYSMFFSVFQNHFRG
jgi:hypothetical protein